MFNLNFYSQTSASDVSSVVVLMGILMMGMMRVVNFGGSMIITNQQACPDVIVGSMFIFNCPGWFWSSFNDFFHTCVVFLLSLLCVVLFIPVWSCSCLCVLLLSLLVLCGLVHTCVVLFLWLFCVVLVNVHTCVVLLLLWLFCVVNVHTCVVLFIPVWSFFYHCFEVAQDSADHFRYNACNTILKWLSNQTHLDNDLTLKWHHLNIIK